MSKNISTQRINNTNTDTYIIILNVSYQTILRVLGERDVHRKREDKKQRKRKFKLLYRLLL